MNARQFFTIVLLIVVAVCSVSAESGSQNKRPPLIVSDYPSIVRVDSCLIRRGCGEDYAIFAMIIRTRDPLVMRTISVEAAGFGSARLIALSDTDPCSPAANAQSHRLVLGQVTESGTRICVFVPLALIPDPAMSLKGDIVTTASGFEPINTRIEIQRAPLPSRTAFLWFIGIAAPALIGFWLNGWATRMAESRTRRNAQIDAFEKHKDAHNAAFRSYFEDYLPSLSDKSGREFIRAAYGELVNQGSWSSIPWKERRRLDKYVRLNQITDNDLTDFKDQLYSLFPEWQEVIKKL